MSISKQDYNELVRLMENGCKFVIKFRGFPLPFGLKARESGELIFSKRKLGFIPSGYQQYIPAAIADYDREHKEDV